MHGLMSAFFGPFAGYEPERGYFYLCPACFRERIAPHLDEVRRKAAHLHPSARPVAPEAEPEPGLEGGEGAGPAVQS